MQEGYLGARRMSLAFAVALSESTQGSILLSMWRFSFENSASVQAQYTTKGAWSLDDEFFSKILSLAFDLCLIILSLASTILLETDEVV